MSFKYNTNKKDNKSFGHGKENYGNIHNTAAFQIINAYSLFGAIDNEMIEMLSIKIGKKDKEKISEITFYRLKKESMAKRGQSGEWLDYYARFHFVKYYRKGIEALELVQKKFIENIVFEPDNKENDNKTDKFLINQIAKTIVETSKDLTEFGMAPPILAK